MSDITESAAATLANLRNYARDFEADLGKISRNRINNPNLGEAQPFIENGGGLASGDHQNEEMRNRALTGYKIKAAAALNPYNGLDLAGTEKIAVGAVRSLLADIDAVQSYEDAKALVATFGGE